MIYSTLGRVLVPTYIEYILLDLLYKKLSYLLLPVYISSALLASPYIRHI